MMSAPTPDHPSARRYMVCGVPRSGTSLLHRLLGEHPDTFAGRETHLLIVAADLQLGPHLTLDEALRLRTEVARHRRFEQGDLPDIQHATDIYDLMFSLGNPPEGAVVGEKTPGHLEHALAALRYSSTLRVIVIVRDPRDVLPSLAASDFNRASRWSNLGMWLAYWDLANELVREFPTRVEVVRFEDLVRDPEQILSKLFNFLDISDNSASICAIREAKPVDPNARPAFQRVNQSRGSAWQSAPKLFDRFAEVACATELASHGYPSRSVPVVSALCGRTLRVAWSTRSTLKRVRRSLANRWRRRRR